MQRFTDLKVWQKAHLLTIRIYVLTQAFPEEEKYGLAAQMRRAATSISTNVAEGSKRAWARDYSRFLNIAQGSAAEVEGLLLLGRDLGFVSVETTAPLLEEVDHISRMLEALRQRVDRDGPRAADAARTRAALPSTLDAGRSTTGGAHARTR